MAHIGFPQNVHIDIYSVIQAIHIEGAYVVSTVTVLDPSKCALAVVLTMVLSCQVGLSPRDHPIVDEPVLIPGLECIGTVADVTAGGGHSIIACPDGGVWSWGDNRWEGRRGIISLSVQIHALYAVSTHA